MAEALNDMVAIYPDSVLAPQITAISDRTSREKKYCEYLMNTFYKHAKDPMVDYGEYYNHYGNHYKAKLLKIIEPKLSKK